MSIILYHDDYLSALLSGSEQLDHDMGQLKKVMKAHGVNQRGWRLYIDYGDALFGPLISHMQGKTEEKKQALEAMYWLRLLQACEMDIPHRYSLRRQL